MKACCNILLPKCGVLALLQVHLTVLANILPVLFEVWSRINVVFSCECYSV